MDQDIFMLSSTQLLIQPILLLAAALIDICLKIICFANCGERLVDQFGYVHG